jgi:hypothetical protein
MKFEEFWNNLNELLQTKRDFVTIHDKKPFQITPSKDAIRVDSDTISTPCVIKKEEFFKVYRASLNIYEFDRYHPGNYTKITKNDSYIITLFNYIMNQR